MSSVDNAPEIKMDPAEMYREEVFTDRQIGTIRRMTPVTVEGQEDSSRDVIFVGSTQVYTPAGTLPVTFELEVDSLEQAIAGFGDAAEAAVAKTIEELRAMQREAASSIVVPGGGGGGGGMGGAMGGNMGGGNIQIP